MVLKHHKKPMNGEYEEAVLFADNLLVPEIALRHMFEVRGNSLEELSNIFKVPEDIIGVRLLTCHLIT